MSRKEFRKEVRRAAVRRAAGRCEGILTDGSRCCWPLSLGKWAIDHVNPDGLTGEPTLENAQVLCVACHKSKTAQDVKNIAQAKRRQDAHLGTGTPRQKIKSAGFPKAPRRKPASDPIPKLRIAYRPERSS